MVKGFIGGLVAAAIGAGVWALISWMTNYEIGWIAIGIGALVGAGVGLGGKSTNAGITAVLLTVLSIAGGKYAAISLVINDEMGGEFTAESLEADVRAALATERGLIESVADDIAWQRTEDGEVLDWPRGMSYETAYALTEYPQDVQLVALERTQIMSPEDREAYVALQVANAQMGMDEFLAHGGMGAIRSDAFMYQWGLMDILFIGIAVFTAFRVASETGQA